jgi:CRISPR-associated protein Cas1
MHPTDSYSNTDSHLPRSWNVSQPSRGKTIAADDAVTLIWVGSGAVRAYSTITPLAVRADLIHRQVSVWADRQQRLAAARRLYKLRFPDDECSAMTMAELRAAEGRRVRETYRDQAAAYNVRWTGRNTSWECCDDLNKAITTAYQALYGAALAVIQALGLHPALGFIHTGKQHALAYDLADLHKTSIGLTVALETFTQSPTNIEQATRAAMNRTMRRQKLLSAMISDLHQTIGVPPATIDQITADELELFDLRGNLPARTNYSPHNGHPTTTEQIPF